MEGGKEHLILDAPVGKEILLLENGISPLPMDIVVSVSIVVPSASMSS